MAAPRAFLLAALALCVGVVGPAARVAVADSNAEPTPFERGLRHYQAGEYAAAAKAFEVAHEARGDAESLFALAQATRLAGDCEAAVPHYHVLLESDLSAEQRRVVRDALELCGDELEASRDSAAEASDETQPEGARAAGDGADDSHRAASPARARWTSRIDGPMIVGASGVVSLGVGVGYWMSARRQAGLAGEARIEEEYAYRARRARTRQQVAIAAALVSAGAAAAAITWELLDGGAADPESRVGAWIDERGGGIAVQGRF